MRGLKEELIVSVGLCSEQAVLHTVRSSYPKSIPVFHTHLWAGLGAFLKCLSYKVSVKSTSPGLKNKMREIF